MITQAVGEAPKVLCLLSSRDVLERLGQCSQWEVAQLPWPLFVGEVAGGDGA